MQANRTLKGRDALIAMTGLGKTYETPAGAFVALSGIDLALARGDFVAVVGKSGSGKSTLINLLTGIDRPSAGTIMVANEPVTGKNESQLAAWRGKNVGIVFQFFQLLPTLTIAENVMLPMDLCGTYPGKRRQRALELLGRVGIAEQADKFPAALSGGQQQRAAIARALANDPPLLVADEPTGNLDSRTSDAILTLFSELATQGTTVVIVTHERDIERIVDRTIVLADGRIESDTAGSRARAVQDLAAE
ncbi:MAG: ABC transporter ATP-binding protein [Devosia nanyangense]|uniref:ABC transporter ATP-binding protein n=1 Tax=Devosia nanyangense TaxID=1228055 RepID=A0A933NXU7_9HYPH|nr:ABC transporter ATP-binding protein [Devosia nanyangense]